MPHTPFCHKGYQKKIDLILRPLLILSFLSFGEEDRDLLISWYTKDYSTNWIFMRCQAERTAIETMTDFLLMTLNMFLGYTMMRVCMSALISAINRWARGTDFLMPVPAVKDDCYRHDLHIHRSRSWSNAYSFWPHSAPWNPRGLRAENNHSWKSFSVQNCSWNCSSLIFL